MSDPVKEARATVNQIQEIAFTIPPMNPYTPQIVQVAAHLYEQLIAIDSLLTEKDRENERLRECLELTHAGFNNIAKLLESRRYPEALIETCCNRGLVHAALTQKEEA